MTHDPCVTSSTRCAPPQSLTLGGIVAHVLTHAAHPITWLETRP